MLRSVTDGLLVVHGLITITRSPGVFGRRPENPAWPSCRPTPIGRWWLRRSLSLENVTVSWLAAALWSSWLVGGVAVLGAGFGLFTYHGWGPTLAVIGAFAPLLVLAPYFHLMYAFVAVLNIAIPVALLWLGWPSANLFGA